MGRSFLKYLSRMEVPLVLFQQTSEGEWRTGRWSPGGLEVKRRRSLIFEQEVYCQLLESVFGGVLFTQCGDIPLLMTGSKIFELQARK